MVAGRRVWTEIVRWRDPLLAAGLFGIALAALTAIPADDEAHRAPDLLAVALLLAMTGVLVVRRRWPVGVLAVNFAAVVGYQLLDYPAEPTLPAVLFALYTVASTGERRRSLVVGALTCVLVVVTLAIAEPGSYRPELVGALGWVIVALALGEAVRYHRAYTAEVEDRLARAESTREAEARQRVADERMRIARDVHDVLAHSIAAINVQAGVAAHLIEETPRPDEATLAAIGEILRGIAETSRGGVADLRATLDWLRDDDVPVSDPVPGLHGLPELAGALRAGGTELTVEVSGDRRPLPPGHDVAAFRIIQEAVTNAVKHGRSHRIDVRVVYDLAALRIVVTDDGPGRSTDGSATARRGGYGILGMTERAHSVGGRLTAAPRTGRGFEVQAVLPLPLAAPVPAPAREPR
ncbi:sensor histidine kinase [Plantactinospora endophytica]|uniref:histidine kinase n=1 Tax=Plantactinospora endophytica TaxID=673535 RepID=A0ABQ4ECS5_9ACTN|nr:sensor histidine kinase [Plantactinospora endophytica]GIG92086.1 two-component sensor histidine kinase [Plantactinospora endophytica]